MEVVLPTHVKACQHSQHQHEKWFVWTWNRAKPEVQSRIPYSCGSWRCDVCARHEAAVTFARIKQAVEPLSSDGWCFIVLTLDRNGYYKDGKAQFKNVTDAYRSMGSMCEKLIKRMRRRWGVGNEWVAVVEAHRSGWPHLNLLVHCPALADDLRSLRSRKLADPEIAEAVQSARDAWRDKAWLPPEVKAKAREAKLMGGELLVHAIESGWGLQSTAEVAESTDAVAGYVVKLAKHHDASVGEVAKVTQAPKAAPERFRRLRAGRRFLPARYKNEAVTGCLMRRRRSESGDWELLRVNPPKDMAQREAVISAARSEHHLIEEEESILSRTRGRMPGMPPVRLAVAGKLESHLDTSQRRWESSLRSACA